MGKFGFIIILGILVTIIVIVVIQRSRVQPIQTYSGPGYANKSDVLIPAVIARAQKNENAGSFMGSGFVPAFFTEISTLEAQGLFHTKMIENPGRCSKTKRFGNAGDGGYEICLDEPFHPKPNNCLVYSFGINNEWSFDDAVNKDFGCEIHSFDPSMNVKDHLHKPNMYFHNLGIWGSNKKQANGWELKDLATIVKMLKHDNRVIDFLKIDVEGAEWPLIEHIVHSGVHSQIKQMVLEIHTPRTLSEGQGMTTLDYGEIFNGYEELEKVGFIKYLYHTNNNCCGAFKMLTPKEITKTSDLCCYETFHLNTNFKV